MNRKILVIGSVAVDSTIFTRKMPQTGSTIIGDKYMVNVGGKGANQACSALFLGGNVSFIGSIGEDHNG